MDDKGSRRRERERERERDSPPRESRDTVASTRRERSKVHNIGEWRFPYCIS